MKLPGSLPDPAECRELDALGEELRDAFPLPELSPGFLEDLRSARVPIWSFRRALRQNLLIRVATVLLVGLTATVPVLAVVSLILRPATQAPILRFQPRPDLLPSDEGSARAVPGAIAPDEPPLQELLSDAWVLSVERENRLQRASYVWRHSFPRPLATTSLPEALPEPLRRGLELRLGRRPPSPVAPAEAFWGRAGPWDLWAELERRLARGSTEPIPTELVERVAHLEAKDDPVADFWLRGWAYVLHGEETSTLPPPPPDPFPGWKLLWRELACPELPWSEG